MVGITCVNTPVLIDQTNKNVKWNVFFNGYNNQNWGIYTRDSYHSLYGNQLFI
ncbi:leukocidin family pore-forming toxin [Bacillus sp. B-TM1]